MPSVYIISDLHLEFGADPIQQIPQADILVLAGDVGNVKDPIGCNVLSRFFKDVSTKAKDVVYVLGNHEYYGCNYDRDEVIHTIRDICKRFGIHLLHRESEIIQGIEFIGATLWSMISQPACSMLADFPARVFRSRAEYISEFQKDHDYLMNALASHSQVPRVVVTHHLPTVHLIHPRFAGYSELNTAFYTDILSSLNLKGVKLWACGHTHEFVSYTQDDCIFVVNPVGYPGEERRTQTSKDIYNI